MAWRAVDGQPGTWGPPKTFSSEKNICPSGALKLLEFLILLSELLRSSRLQWDHPHFQWPPRDQPFSCCRELVSERLAQCPSWDQTGSTQSYVPSTKLQSSLRKGMFLN